jgi:predicted DNA-binding protein (UPF0251 family)
MRFLTEVRISVDELEAIRLKDQEGLDQEECAVRMNVSRPTVQRILASAHQKVADALLNGKALKIEGGTFELANGRFRCQHGHEWRVEAPIAAPPVVCPVCNTNDITAMLPREYHQRVRGWGRRRDNGGVAE